MATDLSNPKAVVELGEKIYAQKYKVDFEAQHHGEFVVIDVTTEQAYLGATPEAAFNATRAANARGPFHLIRVGAPGAYHVSSHRPNANVDWIFR